MHPAAAPSSRSWATGSGRPPTAHQPPVTTSRHAPLMAKDPSTTELGRVRDAAIPPQKSPLP